MLGLDPGEARIGVALSDPTGTLCTPAEAVKRTLDGADIRRIAEIAQAEGAVTIVVGLPLTMEGGRGTQAQLALRFAGELRKAVAIPVMTWDERLTTVEAISRLRDGGGKVGRDKGRVDSVAAALMLESYLSAHK